MKGAAGEAIMITADEQLAIEILDALDSRCLPGTGPALGRAGRQERYRLEQSSQMTGALVRWLERWMDEAGNQQPGIGDQDLWQAVSALHDRLALSQHRLWQTATGMGETAAGRSREMGSPVDGRGGVG